MFEIMKPTGSRPLRRLLAFLGSCLVHAVVVIVLVVIPLMWVNVLPVPGFLTFLTAPPLLPAAATPKLPPSVVQAATLPAVRVVKLNPDVFVTPREIPKEIPPPREDPPDFNYVPPGTPPGNTPGGPPSGNFPPVDRFGPPGENPVVSPPPPPKPKKREALRVGGNVQESKLIRRVDPTFPELAKRARVQGQVILLVLVDETGHVADVTVQHGNPLLDAAAVYAVKQWVYSPTLLNGEPVPVLATVTIIFNLR